jgi:isocitrate/isopropylmalate dehydrogenase
MYQHIKAPASGNKITVNKDASLSVPDQPIIPFIEGDGTGVDITPVMRKVVDAAVAAAYGGKRRISWMEMFAGEKSCRIERLAARGNAAGVAGFRGVDQGAADHAGWRRDPVDQRCVAPGA